MIIHRKLLLRNKGIYFNWKNVDLVSLEEKKYSSYLNKITFKIFNDAYPRNTETEEF